MDGVSGPGVGAAESDVQGELNGILGMLVTEGWISGVVAGVGVQDPKEIRKRKDAMRYRLNWRMLLLMDRFQKLVEGCHPRNGVDEVCKRSALFTQCAHRRADRILSRRAAGLVRIGSMECKISLVEFADEVSVLPE